MSAGQDTTPGREPVIEQRSKVKVTRNAKGDPQWEVSVVEGTETDEMNRIRTLAVQTHLALVAELSGGVAAPSEPVPGPSTVDRLRAAAAQAGDAEPGPES